ncbi:MAG: NADP-dependent phosphogluconate dehydrogenase [Magnetococcales bacterium]|nr:NADP-dependent phosphogluconate dehydrogenase [Magnetococcales bacterium]MBF0150124.1 NADP-dependent phosphogluconate dehydrogenase [Magnetococcales bacterium]MBF0172854.1 NADP-dependent phosphogluconate dehydrogenase [Magnetococcales bacterium]MBF0348081.1 NADP-dependent phosphogluconate dehydrogenase [Magnetococcales bacterium]MBF0631255.1 NADP-dependent phosphogluconate dehydrogenase [Magnetococcales bacterium]
MDIGLIGLATMGRNLALNMLERGVSVAGFDIDPDCRHRCTRDSRFASAAFSLHESLDAFIATLNPPRLLILLIKAGQPVDQILSQLIPKLNPGDVILDGGNSHFTDTIRRARELSHHGIRFLGAGISGGAQGARHGPAIMLGGHPVPHALEHLLQTISARFDTHPCLVHLDGDGAGHFVKMIHNGIEYADMQLLAESQFLLQHLIGLDYPGQAAVFNLWNQGALSSYLTATTARILDKTDPETGLPALEIIHDEADHKGTGQWAAQIALELGVSAPNIMQAVDARLLSKMQPERHLLRQPWRSPILANTTAEEKEWMIPALAGVLLAARITAFAQGFKIFDAASQRFNWHLDKGAIAACWRRGCILQGILPERIRQAYATEPDLVHLLLDPVLGQHVAQGFDRGRNLLAFALNRKLPVAGLITALSFFDALRQHPLWTRIIAAQRDCFGAHGFVRSDRNQRVSWDWS